MIVDICAYCYTPVLFVGWLQVHCRKERRPHSDSGDWFPYWLPWNRSLSAENSSRCLCRATASLRRMLGSLTEVRWHAVSGAGLHFQAPWRGWDGQWLPQTPGMCQWKWREGWRRAGFWNVCSPPAHTKGHDCEKKAHMEGQGEW